MYCCLVYLRIYLQNRVRPEYKYFFTPNVSVRANPKWDELYSMVNEKDQIIYMCYDGKEVYIRQNHINDSGEEVVKILSKIKDNYNCVKEYAGGMYKWERK